MRALYRETVEGKARLRDIVRRQTEKDIKEHERAKFTMRARQWRMAA